MRRQKIHFGQNFNRKWMDRDDYFTPGFLCLNGTLLERWSGKADEDLFEGFEAQGESAFMISRFRLSHRHLCKCPALGTG